MPYKKSNKSTKRVIDTEVSTKKTNEGVFNMYWTRDKPMNNHLQMKGGEKYAVGCFTCTFR